MRFVPCLVLMVVAVAAPPAGAVKYLRPVSAQQVGARFCVVDTVVPNTPASMAGLQPGDTLLTLNGAEVDPQTFSAILAEMPGGGPVTLQVGRADGRVSFTPTLSRSLPRLGVKYLPGYSISDKVAMARSRTATIAGAVFEWSNCSILRIDITNSGTGPEAFGPDSVMVVDGRNHMALAISPTDFLTLKYGGKITSVAGDLPRSMGDAIAKGMVEGFTEASREVTTRQVLNGALRQATLPPGVQHGGSLFYAVEHFAGPLVVRVHFGGERYLLTFAGK